MNASESSPRLDWRRLPWATVAAGVLAVVVYFWPAATRVLIFDRTRIAGGDWWRLLTAYWVHFTPSALIWNLAVLIPAGIWAEWLAPARTRSLYLVGPIFIGAVLYFTVPALDRYAGLSGLAAAMLVMLALSQLRAGAPDRWFWRAVLGLVALKVAVEAATASAIFSHVSDAGLQAVPLAHLAGISAGIAVRAARRRPRRSRS